MLVRSALPSFAQRLLNLSVSNLAIDGNIASVYHQPPSIKGLNCPLMPYGIISLLSIATAYRSCLDPPYERMISGLFLLSLMPWDGSSVIGVWLPKVQEFPLISIAVGPPPTVISVVIHPDGRPDARTVSGWAEPFERGVRLARCVTQ